MDLRYPLVKSSTYLKVHRRTQISLKNIFPPLLPIVVLERLFAKVQKIHSSRKRWVEKNLSFIHFNLRHKSPVLCNQKLLPLGRVGVGSWYTTGCRKPLLRSLKGLAFAAWAKGHLRWCRFATQSLSFRLRLRLRSPQNTRINICIVFHLITFRGVIT